MVGGIVFAVITIHPRATHYAWEILATPKRYTTLRSQTMRNLLLGGSQIIIANFVTASPYACGITTHADSCIISQPHLHMQVQSHAGSVRNLGAPNGLCSIRVSPHAREEAQREAGNESRYLSRVS